MKQRKNRYKEVFTSRLREFVEGENKRGEKERLAKALGVSPSVVSMYASGDSGIGLDKLIALAKYYHVSTDYLLGLSDVKTASTDIRKISEYTGLTPESINALHYMNECYLQDLMDPLKSLSLRVINRVLEGYNDEWGKA